MGSAKNVRQRATVIVVMLCMASGLAWSLAQHASARGAASGSVAATQPGPVAPHPLTGSPARAATTAAAATNVHCGQVITASVTLNGDLDCPSMAGSYAVIVSGSTAVTLNLNGHTVSVQSSDSGILALGPSDIVENGFVTGGNHGVDLQGSKETATKLIVTGSVYGINDFGSGSKVTANTATNDGTAITADGIGGTISGNRAASNSWGIYVERPATVTGNFSDGNVYEGIYVVTPGSTFTSNSLDNNGYDGFFGGGLASVDGGGNTAHGNGYTVSASDQCYGITCS